MISSHKRLMKFKRSFNMSSVDCDDLNSQGEQFFSIQSLLGTLPTRNINFSDPYSISGNIAGGTGSFNGTADRRWISGGVVARLRGTSTLEIESKLVFNARDAVDFQPGDLGASIERVFRPPRFPGEPRPRMGRGISREPRR